MTLAATAAGEAALGEEGGAVRRAARLAKGVVLDGLFSGVGTKADTRPSADGAAQAGPDVPTDMATIARLGFDHVRLEFDAGESAAGEDAVPLDPRRLQRLDQALDAAASAGLAVIVCPCLDQAGTVKLFRNRSMLRGYAALLRELAGRLSGRNAETVFLQVLGEGFVDDMDLWDLMMEMLTAQGRRGWPGGTLIVPRNACVDGRWDVAMGLMLGRQVSDANVIYDVSFYDPVLFTHQGAAGRFGYTGSLRGLPYPGSPDALRPVLLEIRDVPARAAAQEYGTEGWNAGRVRREVDRLADWSDRWKVPLRCGRLGVRREGPPASARAVWLGDVRAAIEKRGMGWTVRQWRGEFGLTGGENGQAMEPALLRALGLKPAPLP